MASRYSKNQPTVLETIVVGLLKALWFLITLPFKGLRSGKRKTGLSTEERNYITEKRLEIEKMLNSENEIELKHAVMEADKLVDHALKQKGYAGETFADRLRFAKESVPYGVYDQVWQGHKVRNQLAHEQGARIMNQELRGATSKLLNFLKTI